MVLKPDFVAKAASPQVGRDCIEAMLKDGFNLVVLIIGVFADAAFFNIVKETATEINQKVDIASGTVGDFDVLRIAA